ncbi:MAG TPA: serine/threonine-protein kinase [Nannocystis sp.]|jgi:serine/threonine-protein kinase
MPQEAKADALIGTVLEGRFHVEQLLGEGGMGRVYVADEKRLQRRCALKVLLPELAGDKDCVERFLREAQAIAQIHHENVVDIYHLGDDSGDGVVFFAMELLQGEDLETRLLDRERRPLSWEQICQWIGQAAGAVAAVHAAGMIHRDLKPSNIFIAKRRDGRQRIKLLDFGIVKTTNRAALTSTGAAIGTPYYMSPEQVLALPLDPRADIYSLGAVLFEALAGRPVFLGEALQVAMQHCNVPAPRLSAVAPNLTIPPELEALVAQMLAKDPAERPQSMAEIEEFLNSFTPAASPLLSSGSIARPVTRPHSFGSIPSQSLPTVPVAQPTAPTVEAVFDFATPPPARRRLVIPALVGTIVVAAGVVAVLLRGEPETSDPVTPQGPVATVQPVVTPPPEPVVTPVEPGVPSVPVVPTPTPTETDPRPPPDTKLRKPDPKPLDPMKQIAKAAVACRKQHKAPAKPKMTIDYATGSDGRVTRAVPAINDALGKCFAAAVKATRFPPQLRLGLKTEM